VAAEDTAAWVMTGEPVRAPGGLRYWELERGEGAEAKAGMAVAVHYVGRLEDGSIFDDSYRRGAPLEFRLGSGAVIRGWDQGIQGMRVGGRRNLVVPPNLAYGERGYPGVIPPNATLVFQLVLTDAR
jgi:FKBP-type peptidyl-prolyl cis-trans isomerase